MAIPGDHRSIEKASAAPWLPGWEPRAGRLARARLTRQADVAEIERFRPEDLLPGATIFDCLEAATALNPEKSAMVALTSHDLAASPRVLSYTDLLASLTRTANLFHHLSEGAAPSVGIVLPMVPAGLIAAFAAATCGTRDADQSLSGTAPYRGVTAGLASRHPLDDGRCDLDQARRHQGRGSELASCVVPRCLRHYQGFRERCAAPSLRQLGFHAVVRPRKRRHAHADGRHDGAPKLAKLTHMGLLTVAWSVGALMGPTEDGVVGHAMPNFHIGGTCALGLRTLLYGQTLLTLTRDGFRNPASSQISGRLRAVSA